MTFTGDDWRSIDIGRGHLTPPKLAAGIYSPAVSGELEHLLKLAADVKRLLNLAGDLDYEAG